jgi:DNA (cytosine-5)-methyltransferase 1
MNGLLDGDIVDLFAGGGGASVGMEAALDRPVDLAINHSPPALAVHRANHPRTRHLEADIWEVRPREATGGKRVSVLWASPDCTHFSVAKGGQPREQGIRSLAWVVVDWAREVRPAVIFLENVQEFRGWGPLDSNGKPIKARMGETFRKWHRQLEQLGYQVDHRILDASLYGAPTRRRRLFLVARCDGQPIRWPEPTHGPGKLPLHTAAECIDWSIPCPSIFERKRPLAEKTLWRIAQGIRRFVLENPRPYIVGVGGRAGQSHPIPVDQPIGTVTAKNDRAVVAPHLVKVNHGKRDHRGEQLDMPLTTVTAERRGHALVAPSLVQVNHGDDGRTGDRFHSVEAPLGTVTASGGSRALVAPTLVQTSYGERPGQRARYLDLHQPLGTVVAQGQKHALVSAFLAKHFGDPNRADGGGGVVIGQELERPIGTVTARDHHSLAAVALAKLRGECSGADPAEPMPTITAGGWHIAEVRAFLTAYYGTDGTGGQDLFDPMRTIPTRHRLGLVTVEGADYQIVDIGMRMLEPHELLRAQFGRFAAGYDLSPAKTKTAQVRLIGNSVAPDVAEAVVRANLGEPAREVAA